MSGFRAIYVIGCKCGESTKWENVVFECDEDGVYHGVAQQAYCQACGAEIGESEIEATETHRRWRRASP